MNTEQPTTPVMTLEETKAGLLALISKSEAGLFFEDSFDQEEADALLASLHHLEAGKRVQKRLATAVTLSAPAKYIAWANAGGVDECSHGRGAGVPCFYCDLAFAESILRPTAVSAQPEQKGT